MRMDMRAELESLLEEYRGLPSLLDRVRTEVAGVSAAARSSDGCVTVTVSSHGELASLQIDESALRRLDAATLTAHIMQAAVAAAADARRRIEEVVSDALPAGFAGAIRADGTIDVANLLPRQPIDPRPVGDEL
jgi:DNA-binding protein YbaB